MAYLKVISAEGERTVFLSADPVVLGRGQEADVLIKDIKISRRHCVVEPCGGGKWAVRDLESGNGIRVNGVEVPGRVLKPDDVVQLGDTRIVFAGELVQVVDPSPGPEPEAPASPETARGTLRASTSRTARHAARSNAWIPWAAGAACVVVWALVAFKGGTPESVEESASKQVAANAARAAATVADVPRLGVLIQRGLARTIEHVVARLDQLTLIEPLLE